MRVGEASGRLLPLLCAIAFLLQASLLFRPAGDMSSPPLTLNGVRSLAVARNLANGRGATADGAHATNAFQPLFTVLATPLFRGAGNEYFRPLRWLLLVELLIAAATAAVLASIGRALFRDAEGRDAAFEASGARAFQWLVAFLYLVAVGTFLQHFDGGETGLLLLLAGVAWRVYQRGGADTLASAMAMGALLGLVVLARVDAVMLVAIFAAGEFTRRDFDRVDALRRVAIVSTVAAFLTSPWWFYNVLEFGTLAPTNARWSETPTPAGFGHAVAAWLMDAVPWAWSRSGGALAGALRVGLVLAMLAGLGGRRRYPPWSHTTVIVDRTRRFGLYLVAYSLALAVWAGVRGAPQDLPRLFAPLIPCATLAFAVAAWRFARHAPSIAVAGAIALAAYFAFAIVALHQGRLLGSNGFHGDPFATEGRQFVR